jgi:[ribosomal protein S5]-alanine N-acetyltransferase
MIRLLLPEKIETQRLTIQRLKYEDAEEIFYTYASKPECTKYMAWPTHQSIEDTRGFLLYADHTWRRGTDHSYSIRLKDSNRLIGSFGIMNDDGKIQFGYIFSPTQWGRGYATEVCKEMMDRLRCQPNLFRIGTFVDADNIASIKVLLKSGLQEEARLKSWCRFVNQDNMPKDCVLFRLEVTRQ